VEEAVVWWKAVRAGILAAIAFIPACEFVLPEGTPAQRITEPPQQFPFPQRARVVDIDSPGLLDVADTEYRLVADVTADKTAFQLAASHITLNLNGHIVTYGERNDVAECHGVVHQRDNATDIVVCGPGTIRQGAGGLATDPQRTGWNPISFPLGATQVVIAGVELLYRTPETYGIRAMWVSEITLRDNIIEDQGTVVLNRHSLIAAIDISRGTGGLVRGNDIRRTRQVGISSGNDCEVAYNRIHVSSVVTNSYAIVCFAVDGFTVHHNTITGEGVHPIGIGAVAEAHHGDILDNDIEVQSTAVGTEYGDTGAAGIRMTWGTDDVRVRRNHILLRAEKNLLGPGLDSWGRALWVGLPDSTAAVVFEDNVIIARNKNGDGAKAAGIAVVCWNRSPALVFRHNTVISNWANVLLADSYGIADGYPRFIGNTFRKEDADPTYRTIRSDNPSVPSTALFEHTTYENGSAFESMEVEFDAAGSWYDGRAKKDIAQGWHFELTVTHGATQPLAGAEVQITNNAGELVYRGTTGSAGTIATDLAEYDLTSRSTYPLPDMVTLDVVPGGGNKILRTPYRVTARFGAAQAAATVPLTADTRIVLQLQAY